MLSPLMYLDESDMLTVLGLNKKSPRKVQHSKILHAIEDSFKTENYMKLG
jgi:hypothetical protein